MEVYFVFILLDKDRIISENKVVNTGKVVRVKEDICHLKKNDLDPN